MKSYYFVIPYLKNDYEKYGSMRYIVDLCEILGRNNNVTIVTSESKGFNQSNFGQVWISGKPPQEVKGIKIKSYTLENNVIYLSYLYLISKFTKIWYKVFSFGERFNRHNKNNINNIANSPHNLFINSLKRSNIVHFAEIYSIGPILDYGQIVKDAIKNKAKIIVAHSPFYTVYGISDACKKYNYTYSVISFFHANEIVHYNKYFFDALESAEKIYCLTLYERELWNKWLKIPKERLPVINAGTNARILKIDKEKTVNKKKKQILIISRNEPNKNLEQIINLIKKINIFSKNINFVVITNKRLESVFQLNNTKILINPTDERKDQILRNSDIVIFPSLSESFGLVVIEAWSYNIPVFVNKINSATCSILGAQNQHYIYKSENDLFTKVINEIRFKRKYTFSDKLKYVFNWENVAKTISN